MSSSFVLCAACRHWYPNHNVEEASFGFRTRDAVYTIQDLLSGVVGSSEEDCHRLQQVSTELQNLCGGMHEEMELLRNRIKELEEKVEKKNTELASANSKALRATVQSAKITRPSPRGTSSAVDGPETYQPYSPSNANRSVFPGVPEYHVRRMGTALEYVSASLYSLLESLAINTRVDTALLWIRPKNLISNELIAPFVVGRDISKVLASAPYRVPEASVPCAVSMTGIAVNLKPRRGATESRRSEDIPLSELIAHTNAAQLLVPVYARYDSKTVLAVVHLIGSPRFPFPFGRRNEEAAKHAATFFSSVLSSHHSNMINEWANRFYDPSVMQGTSTYRGELDLRGDDKCMDDFEPQPLLIYRCLNQRRSEGDIRDSFKTLKVAMVKKAEVMQPVSCVKDLHRHANNMESNWVSAVKATSQLEHYVSTYKDGLLQEEVTRLRQQRDRVVEESKKTMSNYSWMQVPEHQPPPQSSRASETLKATVKGPTDPALPSILPSARVTSASGGDDRCEDSIHAVDLTVGLSPPVIANGNSLDPTDVLKVEELEDVENFALKRLRHLGVDTTPFLMGASRVKKQREELTASLQSMVSS